MPRLWFGLLVLGVAVAMPLSPPLTTPWIDPQTAVERLYPGVPLWWLFLRLTTLMTAAIILGTLIRAPSRIAQRLRPLRAPHYGVQIAALIVATVHLSLALMAESLPRGAQYAYAGLFVVPPLLLGLATPHMRSRRRCRETVPLLLVFLAWIALSAGIDSARTASAPDLWFCWDGLAAASDAGGNLLVAGPLAGLSSLHLLTQGVGLFDFTDVAATWPRLRFLQGAWLLVAAWSVARAAARLGLSGPVAASVILFNPLALLSIISPCAVFLGNLVAAVGVLALVELFRKPTAAALVAVAAVCGFASTHPSLVPFAAFSLIAAAWLVRSRARPPVAVALTAVCVFLAGLIPAIPDLTTLQDMATRYASRSTSYGTIEGVLLGQVSPVAIRTATEAAERPIEILGAALLTPWFVTPTPIRLWADSLFDPIGAALAAIGFVVALRSWRGRYFLVLGAFAAAILPGVLSNFDRPSTTRMMALGVPMALLAALGAQSVWRLCVARRFPDPAIRARYARASAMLLAMCIAAAGSLLILHVIPSRVPASSLEILLQARESAGSELTVLDDALDHDREWTGRTAWLYVDTMIAATAPEHARAIAFDGPQALQSLRLSPLTMLGWSRAADMDASISLEVCRRWPDADHWTLPDRSGHSLSFAMTPSTFVAPANASWSRGTRTPCRSAVVHSRGSAR